MRRIFWPKGSIPEGSSIAVGWKNGEYDYVVTAILPYLAVHLAERVLAKDDLLEGSKSPTELYDRFNGDKLRVLATINHYQRGCYFTVQATSTIKIEFPDRAPCMIIRYDSPNAHWLSCLSIKPIKLELNNFDDSTIISPFHERELATLNSHTLILKEKVAEHTSRAPSKDHALGICISQINCSHELEALLVSNAQKLFPQLQKQQQERRMSRARRLSQSARNFSVQAGKRASTGVQGILRYVFAVLIWCFVVIRAISEVILKIVNFELYGGYSLRYLSATAQQIDLNLRRLCYFPEQFLVIRKRRHIWFTPEYNEEYIRFYNSLWLGFNDRILGWALGSVILNSESIIVEAFQYLSQDMFGQDCINQINWLMNWPGGLKLHTEITIFLGKVIVWTVSTWRELCADALPFLRVLIPVVAYVGAFGGLTLQIAILCDLLSVITLPFYNFYMSFAKLYRQTLRLFLSLFRLFRGKKWNELRQRVDSEDYDMSQLFLGTIFFTVLLFLLPTLLVFYIAFTAYRLLIIFASACLEMVLGFFNHFPLFLLLLRIKSPGRIPGGIKIVLDENPLNQHTTLELSSHPLSLARIFHQYNMVARRFTQHYLSLKIGAGLLTGGAVTIQRSKLYTILYSMLPKERKPALKLYANLRKELLDD